MTNRNSRFNTFSLAALGLGVVFGLATTTNAGPSYSSIGSFTATVSPANRSDAKPPHAIMVKRSTTRVQTVKISTRPFVATSMPLRANEAAVTIALNRKHHNAFASTTAPTRPFVSTVSAGNRGFRLINDTTVVRASLIPLGTTAAVSTSTD